MTIQFEISDHLYKCLKKRIELNVASELDMLVDKGTVMEQEPQTRHCKDCKHFEYDSVTKVDGIPLILAHETCSRWGNGCKTKEEGYCFLFEPKRKSIATAAAGEGA